MNYILLNLAEAAPSASVPITLAVSAMIGLFLFTMGRKLVKVAVGLSGLCLGAFGAFVLANQLQVSSQLMLVWVIGGAVAGILFATLGFRFWMAASLAGLVAMLVPAFSVIMEGTPAPAASEQVDASDPPAKVTDEPRKPGSDLPVSKFSAEDVKKTADDIRKSIPVSDADIDRATHTIMDVLQRAYDFQKAHLAGWWESMRSEGKRNLTITTAIAGLVGALFGFMLPYFAASIQTSLIGGAMLLSTLNGVVTTYAPAQAGWLPNEPRGILITLSLITLLGVAIQWTLWRKTADK